MHSRAKKSASESRIFAGNCHFLMHKSRVCNEFRRKQSTALGFGVLLLQDKREKLDQGTYFSDFEARVDKSICWLPLVALVAAGRDPCNTSATSKKRAQPAKTSAGPAPISPPFDGLEGRGVILWTISNKLGCKPTDAYEIPV